MPFCLVRLFWANKINERPSAACEVERDSSFDKFESNSNIFSLVILAVLSRKSLRLGVRGLVRVPVISNTLKYH